MVNKEKFEELFLSFNESGKQIWVIGTVKELPLPIVNMALNLATLDFIKCITISDDSLAASSENYPKRPEVPITHMIHPTAIGVQILYNFAHKYIDFFDINSPIKGYGSKMVAAIFKDFPNDMKATVVLDWSGGFWDEMKNKYDYIKWINQN